MDPQTQIWWIKNKLLLSVSAAAVVVLVGVVAALMFRSANATDQQTASGILTLAPISDPSSAPQDIPSATAPPPGSGTNPVSTPAPSQSASQSKSQSLSGSAVEPPPTPIPNPPGPPPPPPPAGSVTHLVSYFEDCFEPNDITVNMGDTVKFKNISWMDNMWVASNNHPTHTTYPGFDAGQPFPPETFYQFTFNNPGTWGYHDHLKPSCTGSITVR